MLSMWKRPRVKHMNKYSSLLPSYVMAISIVCVLSCVPLCVTPWTIARQAPLSMGFSRYEYRSGVALLSSRGSSQPRDGTHFLHLLLWQVGSLPLSHLGSPWY